MSAINHPDQIRSSTSAASGMSAEKCSDVVATSSEPPGEHKTEDVTVVVRRNRLAARCTQCCFGWCEEVRSYVSNLLCCFQRELELSIDGDPVPRTDIDLDADSESTCDNTTSCSTSLGLCGLVNLGHTCFMNSALQCLSSTVPLRKYLTGDFSYHSDGSARKETGIAGALAISFSNLLKEIWSGEHSSVKPDELKKLIGSVAERFTGYSQEDAQEFLTYLLQGLHEDLNRPFSESERIGFPCSQVLSEKEQAELAWKTYLEYNNSKIVELFQGQLKTRLICGNVECGKEISLNFDPFMFLALPLPDEAVVPPSTYERDASEMCPTAYTLHDCLRLMTQETPSEGSKWYCEKCDSDVDIKRKVDIWKLPKILIVYLRRFRATLKERYKIETAVEFPLELDVSPFMATHDDNDVQPHYELFAVIDHYGSIHGGHYTATTLHNGDWYKFDDETFRHLDSVKDVMDSRAAYVLFYERTSSRTKTKVTKPDSEKQKNDNLALLELQEFV